MSDDKLDKAREAIDEADRAMAAAFEKRFQAVEDVIAYKMEHGMDILDSGREDAVRQRNASYIKNDAIRKYYMELVEKELELSKTYQAEIRKKNEFDH